MTSQTAALSVPAEDNLLADSDQRERIERCWRRVGARRATVDMVVELNALISNLQLHRGMCMSLLAGSDYFQQALYKLEQQLQRQLLAVQLLVERGVPLAPEHSQALEIGWLSISRGWQNDEVLDNFELHSHFIEKLQAVVVELAASLQQALPDALPGSDSSSELAGYPKLFRRIELLHFIAQQLPHVIELIAKARGLSCHLASSAQPDPALARTLAFQLQTLKGENQKLRHQAERLKSVVIDYRCLSDIADAELKLFFFFSRIEGDLLSSSRRNGKQGKNNGSMEGPQLFKLASELINGYAQVNDEGWRLLRRWEDDDWRRWLSG